MHFSYQITFFPRFSSLSIVLLHGIFGLQLHKLIFLFCKAKFFFREIVNFSDEEESEFEEGMSKQGSLDSILSHESSNWNLLNNNQSCDIATTNNTSR